MNIIENSSIIQRPSADVFAYINDFNNDVHWRGGVRSMMQTTPTVQVGTETDEILHFMGRDYETLARVTEVAPNSRSVFVSTKGTFPVTGWRQVEAAQGGTRVTMHTEISIGGVMGLFAPLLANAFSRQMRADLITLKRLLEK
ncbi:MAG: SRPBCC family protein [Chloroflexota bacterium]